MVAGLKGTARARASEECLKKQSAYPGRLTWPACASGIWRCPALASRAASHYHKSDFPELRAYTALHWAGQQGGTRGSRCTVRCRPRELRSKQKLTVYRIELKKQWKQVSMP